MIWATPPVGLGKKQIEFISAMRVENFKGFLFFQEKYKLLKKLITAKVGRLKLPSALWRPHATSRRRKMILKHRLHINHGKKISNINCRFLAEHVTAASRALSPRTGPLENSPGFSVLSDP